MSFAPTQYDTAMNKRILVLSKFDSFARMAKRVADAFVTQGFMVDYRLIAVGREALSPRIYREIGLPEETPVTTMENLFCSGEITQFAAVYLGATGAFIRDFLGHMRASFLDEGTPRPLTLTGYPGLILREKLSGFANRCGCDFVLLNSSTDLDDYRRFCRNYRLSDSGAQLFGYAFPPFHKERTDSVRRVLFVEQATIPGPLKERLYLAKRLVLYASAHPEREVIVKPRLVPGEKSVFTTKYHMEVLLKSLPRLPGNLHVDYGDIQGLLETADLCLTVSSTVALQSMWYGIPTGIIRDFGIRDEYGTDFFRESGCLVSFDELEGGQFPAFRPEWFSRRFMACNEILPALAESLAQEYGRRELFGDWRSNGNFEAVFCEAYRRFHLEYGRLKPNTMWTFLAVFFRRVSHCFSALSWNRKWRKRKKCL